MKKLLLSIILLVCFKIGAFAAIDGFTASSALINYPAFSGLNQIAGLKNTGVNFNNFSQYSPFATALISSQPTDQAACDGGSATFSIIASDAVSYQWQVNQGSGFVNIVNDAQYANSTTNTLTITGATSSMNGYLYRSIATGSSGPAATSDNAKLSVFSGPVSVVFHPIDRSICAGEVTTFQIGALNASSYQWQVDQHDGAGFNNIPEGGAYANVATSTLTITAAATAGMNGYSYRCVASGPCSAPVTSQHASLSVSIPPFISSSPSNATVCEESATTFTVYSINASTFQWQVDDLTGAGFTNVANGGPYSGAKTPVLTVTALASMNGYRYRCVAGNACQPSPVMSGSATLSVNSKVITPSQTNLTCNGANNGAASVVVTGGSGSFSYDWTPGSPTGDGTPSITGLSAGTYSVIVTDINTSCATTKTFTITQPTALTATASSTNVTCNGSNNGSATVTAAGGTLPYTYVWSAGGSTTNTATGLAPGSYSVTITDANGCSASQSVTITEPAALTATAVQTNVTCNNNADGTATVTVSGGTVPYTYSWSAGGSTTNSATGLAPGLYTVNITDAGGCITSQSVTITEPAPLAATAVQTNVTCNSNADGTATVTVNGGTLPYTYSWSAGGSTTNSATGLAPGSYTVNITDAKGCTASQSVTITEPAPLTATAVQTNVTCNGNNDGTATVTVNGGTLPYTYSWSAGGSVTNSATGLAPGNYTVNITDAKGCTTSQSVTITEPVALSATIAQTNVTCNNNADGTATVSVTGGTLPYTYSWSAGGSTTNSATGLAPGNYTVNITDAKGCTTSQSVTITQPAVLTATISSQTNVSCNGDTNGSATVNVTGGTAPYNYIWTSGGTAATATGLGANSYTVTITDAKGCTTSQSVTITEPALLTATAAQTNVTCNSNADGTATITVNGGTLPYTYSWSAGGSTTNSATGLAPGIYTVNITDAKGCNISQSVTITEPAALTATEVHTNVTCNTNADGTATVTVNGGTSPYTYSWSAGGSTTNSATGLAPGIYTVNITDAKGCTTSQSITITEPAALTASIASQTNVSCNGGNNGSATVSAVGGTAPYTYSWPSGATTATATGLIAGSYTVTITDANNCTKTQNVTITEPAALAITASQTSVSCYGGNNGSAAVNVTGGTAPYTYNWSSGSTTATASNLIAGNYTVTITDANSCTKSQDITISQPAALAATATQTNVSTAGGNDGSATVNVSGGTAPYTYSWSPAGGSSATASGLSSGAYTCTITDSNGCSTTVNVNITEVPVLTAPAAVTMTYGDAPFIITPPTSASTGSFTYTSSDPLVASVNGSTVTILKVGTTTITSTQAASGKYSEGTITTVYTIVPKNITVGLNATPLISKEYDGTTAATLAAANYSLNGIIAGDAVTVSSTASYNSSLAANGKTITVNSFVLAGAQKDNYNLTTASATTTGNITKKDITLALNAAPAITKVYDGTTAATLVPANYTLNTLVAGDDVSVSGTAVYDSKNADVNKVITVNNLVLSGAQKDNYNLTTTSQTTTGSISPKAISASFAAVSKVYDGTTNAAVSFNAFTTADGLVASDDLKVTYTAASYNDKNVGAGKAISFTGLALSGADKGNYTLNNLTVTGSITTQAITVTANAISKTYGDMDPQLTYSVTSGSVAAGDSFSGSLTRTAGESIGTYSISQGSLALSANYVLSFTGSNFTIVKRELIISADNKTRFFGSANPGLTLSYSGFANGDDKAVLSPAASVSTSAVITSPLGDYPITVSGAAAANYSITYRNGILTVIPGTPTAINLAPATLFENRPAGTAAGTLSSASDDANATFSFSLVSGAGDTDNSLFSITGNQLKTTASLDYENKSSYSVRVRSTTQHGFLLEKVINISLTDVNEIPTMAVIADQSFCYSNSPLMMTIAGVTAGPEGNKQTTAITASSSNSTLFSNIKVNGNQVSYQIAKGQSGSSTITLTVRDNGGTDNGGVDTYSRTFNVTVKAPLQIAITSDKGTTIGKGETIHLTATGGVKYSWTSANGIISGQQSDVLTIRPSETTTYKVRVTNAEGCEDELTITIVANDDYQLVKGANIITPNGDGINDRLEIKNIDMYPKGELKIFDRAGRLIYSTTNYKNDWDGTFQGSLLAEGTYYYIVDFGPGIGKKKGFLSIVRD